jgi:rRNA maturation protein Nop10
MRVEFTGDDVRSIRRERARAMQPLARSCDAPLGVTNQEPEVLLMAVCPKCGSDRLKIIGQSNTKPPMLHRCTACGNTVAGPIPDAPRER